MTQAGEPLRWLLAHVDHDGDDCLIWPYARTGGGKGYAAVVIDKRTKGAHRIMCGLAHDDAPSKDHQAAHSCGRGHEGCVNPGHLSWKTPKENSDDKYVHGTMVRGEVQHSSRMKPHDIKTIRARRARGDFATDIADEYGVSSTSIYAIDRGKNWAWVQ